MQDAQVTDDRLTAEFVKGFNEALPPDKQLYRLRIKVDKTKLIDTVDQPDKIMFKMAEFLKDFGGGELHIRIDSVKPKEE